MKFFDNTNRVVAIHGDQRTTGSCYNISLHLGLKVSQGQPQKREAASQSLNKRKEASVQVIVERPQEIKRYISAARGTNQVKSDSRRVGGMVKPFTPKERMATIKHIMDLPMTILTGVFSIATRFQCEKGWQKRCEWLDTANASFIFKVSVPSSQNTIQLSSRVSAVSARGEPHLSGHQARICQERFPT